METSETIFKTWMTRVWNQRDASAIDELLAEDAPVHGLGPEPLIGPAGFKRFHGAFLAAFSDIHIEVERQVVDGDQMAGLWSATLSHRATGSTVAATGMVMATVRDGKMREGWNSADFLQMLIGLGIVQSDAMERMLK
jgi:predicted ester cyclase